MKMIFILITIFCTVTKITYGVLETSSYHDDHFEITREIQNVSHKFKEEAMRTLVLCPDRFNEEQLKSTIINEWNSGLQKIEARSTNITTQLNNGRKDIVFLTKKIPYLEAKLELFLRQNAWNKRDILKKIMEIKAQFKRVEDMSNDIKRYLTRVGTFHADEVAYFNNVDFDMENIKHKTVIYNRKLYKLLQSMTRGANVLKNQIKQHGEKVTSMTTEMSVAP